MKTLILLFLLAASAAAQINNGGGGTTPGGACGDSSHALNWSGTAYGCQAITGSAAAGGSTTQLQYNNATALGGISQFTTNGTTTITGSATSVFDLHAAGVGGLLLPGALATGIVKVTTATGAISILTAPAGTIVGTSDTQALTNKDLTGAGNTFPTLNQNTSGTASNLSGTPALPNGTTATTQTVGDNTTKIATDAFVIANSSGSLPSGPTSPNGVPAILTSTPSGGVAGGAAYSEPGIGGRAVTGTTATDTIVSTDCNPKRVEYVGSVAVAVTLPTATTLVVPTCVFKLTNNLSTLNDVTVTPTTWTVNGGASVAIHQGQVATFYVDSNSATNWVADVEEEGLSAGSNITFTRSATGLSIASSGGSCPTCVTSAAALTNNAVVIGGGLQASSTISADTTTTHALMATAGAPAFRALVTGDLPTAIPLANIATQANATLLSNVSGGTAVPSANALPTTANALIKTSNANGALAASLTTDDGTTSTYTGTGGTKSPVFTSTGTTAGFHDYPQGTTSAAVAPCNVATSICEQAPAAVTSYLVTKPGAAGTGVRIGVNSSNVITENFSSAFGAVSQTAKTAAVTTFTVCAATANTGCGQVGQYRLTYNVWGSGTACATVTAGSVVLNFTWTDENAVTHTTINAPMWDQKTAAMTSGQTNFNTALGTEGGSGSFIVSTNGTIIQAATTYTACTSGTGTYNVRITTEQLQ